MKSPNFATIAPAVLVVIAACASQVGAPDPALIEAEIAEARTEELELVRNTIEDAGRAETFMILLGERDRLLERISRQRSKHKRQIAELSADYSAERDEFEALLAEFNHNRRSAQQELVGLITRMKRATNADEWRTISAFQTRRLNLRDIAYRDEADGA